MIIVVLACDGAAFANEEGKKSRTIEDQKKAPEDEF